MPVEELQKRISSRHFTELMAFKNRNTTSPAVCRMIAELITWVAATGGVALDREDLMPGGGRNFEERRKRNAELAERKLDSMSEG